MNYYTIDNPPSKQCDRTQLFNKISQKIYRPCLRCSGRTAKPPKAPPNVRHPTHLTKSSLAPKKIYKSILIEDEACTRGSGKHISGPNEQLYELPSDVRCRPNVYATATSELPSLVTRKANYNTTVCQQPVCIARRGHNKQTTPAHSLYRRDKKLFASRLVQGEAQTSSTKTRENTCPHLSSFPAFLVFRRHIRIHLVLLISNQESATGGRTGLHCCDCDRDPSMRNTPSTKF